MRKLIIFILLLLAGISGMAQPDIGLTVSPSLSSNRVKFKSDAGDISSDGSAIKFKFGLEVDFPLTDTYALSTGLIFAPKRAGFDRTTAEKEEYKLQYLQVPLTIKLYTSEVAENVKLYFQLGFLAEIKVFDEPIEEEHTLIQTFKPYDASFVFGVGAAYDTRGSSTLYAGLVYNRGLVNIVHELEAGLTDDLSNKMDMLSLQLGMKF